MDPSSRVLNVIIYGLLDSRVLNPLTPLQNRHDMSCFNAQNGATPAPPIGQVDSNPQVALLHNLSCNCCHLLLICFFVPKGSTVLTDASSKCPAGVCRSSEDPLSWPTTLLHWPSVLAAGWFSLLAQSAGLAYSAGWSSLLKWLLQELLLPPPQRGLHCQGKNHPLSHLHTSTLIDCARSARSLQLQAWMEVQVRWVEIQVRTALRLTSTLSNIN